MVRLGEVLLLAKDNKIDIDDSTEYRIAGVQSYGKGIVIRRSITGAELTMKKYQLIEDNQLMWCKIDTKNGAFGLTHKEHIGSLASTNMALTNINTKKVLPLFLETLFRLKPFHEYITKLSSGSTNRKYLTPTQLFDIVKIPDLTLEEQKEFLKKVNLLENSGLSTEIIHQQFLLKRLSQSILQDGISGELTERWRKENPDVEPVKELLAQIKAEKEQLVKGKKIKKQKPLLPISDEEKKFELPESWVWCRFHDIANIASNLVDPYEFYDMPHIAPNNIEKNTGKLLNYTTARQDEVISGKHYFYSGQLLYSKVRPNLNKVVIVDFEGLCSADMYPIEPLINNEYLQIYMLSQFFLTEVDKFDNRVKMPKINQNQLNSIIVPLPPMKEQKIIAKIKYKGFSYCNLLDQQISKSQQDLELLMQAVLKEAFETK